MSSWEDADLTHVADRDLMARIATGDARALGFVHDRHGSAAFGLALRIVRDRSHAEDVVQGLLALRASLAPETTVRPRPTAGRA